MLLRQSLPGTVVTQGTWNSRPLASMHHRHHYISSARQVFMLPLVSSRTILSPLKSVDWLAAVSISTKRLKSRKTALLLSSSVCRVPKLLRTVWKLLAQQVRSAFTEPSKRMPQVQVNNFCFQQYMMTLQMKITILAVGLRFQILAPIWPRLKAHPILKATCCQLLLDSRFAGQESLSIMKLRRLFAKVQTPLPPFRASLRTNCSYPTTSS